MNPLDGLIMARRMTARTARGDALDVAQVAEPHAFWTGTTWLIGLHCPDDIKELLAPRAVTDQP